MKYLIFLFVPLFMTTTYASDNFGDVGGFSIKPNTTGDTDVCGHSSSSELDDFLNDTLNRSSNQDDGEQCGTGIQVLKSQNTLLKREVALLRARVSELSKLCGLEPIPFTPEEMDSIQPAQSGSCGPTSWEVPETN